MSSGFYNVDQESDVSNDSFENTWVSIQIVKKSAHFANSISIYYYVHFLLLGVRQEQDIYVRLIDSVTKQVSLLCTSKNFTKQSWI